MWSERNSLYCGDNLDVLPRYCREETVDLVYLDPPFNSAQNYSALFKARGGARVAEQVRAFEDTWRWDPLAAAAFGQTVEQGGHVADALAAFRQLLGETGLLAYLS